MSAAGHEASEGDGAAGEKPEGAVGETGEVQRAGTGKNQSGVFAVVATAAKSHFCQQCFTSNFPSSVA